jgi:hypothetical protein
LNPLLNDQMHPTMPRTRYLRIRFNNPIYPREIPCFRAAVIEETERQSNLFHNHKGDTSFIYRYPLIQYKVMNRKAGMVCLNQGTDDIHYLLQKRQIRLQLGDQPPADFQIEDIHLHYFDVQLWKADLHYSLLNWQALNQQNFAEYQSLTTEMEELQFLEKLLKGHLLAFASGIDWDVEEEIKVRITNLKQKKWLPYKGKKILTFTLNFTTNVSLPDYIGLGKGSSVGFGSVKRFNGQRRTGTGRR